MAGPHENDPPYVQKEHAALAAFVDPAKFTRHAVVSGEWNDPTTWGGSLLVDGENARIPAGVMVTLKGQSAGVPKILRVDGILSFGRNADSRLKVDTIIGMAGSTIDLGTIADPIPQSVTAEIVFRDAGPIDVVDDPREWGHGLVSHGAVLIHGAVKTRIADLAISPAYPATAGATQILLTTLPVNWQPGETIVVAGTDKTNLLDSYDVCKIQSVVGNVVNLQSPLVFAHGLPSPYKPFVIHLDSNVVIRSEKSGYGIEPLNPLVKSAAHFMVMHSGVNQSVIKHAKFQDLGRTDKRVPLNSPKFDSTGNRIAGTGTNSVGRYACHFHRGKISGSAAVVEGCVAAGSAGWGFVNHSSNVAMKNCVTFDCLGAGFVAEICDEIGSIDNCAAIYSRGTGVLGINTRSFQQERDFWFEGLGFGLMSPRVKVRNFKAANCSFGFSSWPINLIAQNNPVNQNDKIYGLIEKGDLQPGEEYLLPFADANGKIIPMMAHLDIDGVLAFNCNRLTDIQESFPTSGRSVVKNITGIFHSIPSDVLLDYTWNIDYENWNIVSLMPQTLPPYYHTIKASFETMSHTYRGCRFVGGGTGINAPKHGIIKIENCIFQNVINISLPGVQSNHTIGENGNKNIRTREVQLNNNTFLPKPGSTVAGQKLSWGIPNTLYLLLEDRILVAGQQLYRSEQAGEYVPFPSPRTDIPPYLIGLNNEQMLDAFGCCVLNAVMPADAVMNTEYGFKQGAPSARLGIKLESPAGGLSAGAVVTPVVRTYQAGVYEPVRITLPPLTVAAGWQPVVFTIDGEKYSVHLFGTGVAPPLPPPTPPPPAKTITRATIQFSDGTATVIPPAGKTIKKLTAEYNDGSREEFP